MIWNVQLSTKNWDMQITGKWDGHSKEKQVYGNWCWEGLDAVFIRQELLSCSQSLSLQHQAAPLQVAGLARAPLNHTPGCEVSSLLPTYLHVPKCLHQGNDLQLIQCGQVQDLFDFGRARETKTTLRGAGRPPFRLPILICQVPGGLYWGNQ